MPIKCSDPIKKIPTIGIINLILFFEPNNEKETPMKTTINDKPYIPTIDAVCEIEIKLLNE